MCQPGGHGGAGLPHVLAWWGAGAIGRLAGFQDIEEGLGFAVDLALVHVHVLGGLGEDGPAPCCTW